MGRKSKYRALWKIAGEDKQILRNCGIGTQLRFALSGFITALLFITGVVSYHHTFSQIFNIPNLSWVLGLLFSLMIFNIYKLNLITISTNPSKKGLGYVISFCFRICFMLLLGLTIIKPFEILILKKTLAVEVAYLKVEEINQAIAKTAGHFDEAITSNNLEIKRLNEHFTAGRIEIGKDKLDQLKAKKQKLLSDKQGLIEETERRIDASPHYVKGLLHLNYKFPWVWNISIGFLFIFLLPLFLKYFISRSSSYVRNKAELNRDIILDEYDYLKYNYPRLMQKNTHVLIELEERYEDPPFNLIPKIITRKTGDEEDFLNYLHGL